MHFIQAKSILSAKGVVGSNGMNIYRGCTHGCIYCDSRSTCYQMDHVFEDIAVKENAIELLENTLRRKREKCMIGTGSMSDPYMPLEKELCYTRRALEVIDRHGFGVSLITKSDLVLRDLDLLQSIHEKTKCVIQMSMTIADESLSKIIEPNVITTRQRFEVLKQFRDVGIPTVVWLCPILPFLTDTKENIKEILEMCHEAGVKGIICFGMGMTLREGDREYYYSKLDQHFPGLKDQYIRAYGNAYSIRSPRHAELMQYFEETCDAYGIIHDNDRLFRYMATFEQKHTSEQISLF